MSASLQIAKSWHNLGIATIPIRARDKRPALHQWRRYQHELPRLRDLQVWFQSGRYNLAVITGWRGLVVLDFDDMQVCRDIETPLTYTVKTARGQHRYFFCQEDTECIKGSGWDVKAQGGYVLAPPSVHPSGHIYTAAGTPANIASIPSIWDLVEKPDPPMALTHSTPPDPFDIAMRPEGPGVSINDIKAQYTLHQLLGLPRNGRRHMLKCPLPGHDDRNASFAVFADDHFYCFGCQRYGDVLDFVALRDGLTIAESMKVLTNS